MRVFFCSILLKKQDNVAHYNTIHSIFFFVNQRYTEHCKMDELKLAPFESKSWPHLVGKPVDKAIEEIQRENPDYEIEKLALYSPMKLNLRPNRVRVFFDDDNNVARIPQTG